MAEEMNDSQHQRKNQTKTIKDIFQRKLDYREIKFRLLMLSGNPTRP